MSAGTAAANPTRKASGWMRLLLLFGIASAVEAFTVSHVFRFMPLYLATVHVPPSEVPAWTGYLNAAFFLFGLPLVPFWGVWSERYGRIPIIARSAFVEMVVFAGLWFAQNRWQAGFALLLVGFQLGNTGVMLTALRAVTPRGRVGFAISLFGVTPSLGFALGPAVGGWLVDHGVLNLHSLFGLDAAMSLVAGILLLAFAREGPRPPSPPGSAIQLALQALRTALTGRVTLIVFSVFGLAYFAQQIANPFLPLLVIRLHRFRRIGIAGRIPLTVGGRRRRSVWIPAHAGGRLRAGSGQPGRIGDRARPALADGGRRRPRCRGCDRHLDGVCAACHCRA
jgi:MFS family permease